MRPIAGGFTVIGSRLLDQFRVEEQPVTLRVTFQARLENSRVGLLIPQAMSGLIRCGVSIWMKDLLTMTTTLKEADERGWPTLSVEQSRQVDTIAIREFGISGMTLMENAGKACADRLLDEWESEVDSSESLLILAGGGNNGGDGFVIARCFHERGIEYRMVLLSSVDRLKGDAKTSYERAIAAGVTIETIMDPSGLEQAIEVHVGPILDCVLGTGAKGQPREPLATAIRSANQSPQRRIAIDLPTGFDGDTGEPSDPTFQADLTLTFVTAKSGMRSVNANRYLGDVEVVDIGLPDELEKRLGKRG